MKDLTLRDLEWAIRARWHELAEAIKKAKDHGERVISEVGRSLPSGLERRLKEGGYQVESGTRRRGCGACGACGGFADEEYYIIRW